MAFIGPTEISGLDPGRVIFSTEVPRFGIEVHPAHLPCLQPQQIIKSGAEVEVSFTGAAIATATSKLMAKFRKFILFEILVNRSNR